METKFGVVFPPHKEWQLNKTADTIKFVNNLEEVIEKLQKVMERIKSGEKKITPFTTVMSVICEED